MKDYKNKFAVFMQFDYDGVQVFLEKMAAKGWRLESTDRFIWRFRKADPAEVHYCVIFLPKSSMFDPENDPAMEEYYEYCREMGWTHVHSNDKMHIFCSEEKDPVPIETDEELKLENVKKNMKQIALLMLFASVVICLEPVIDAVSDPISLYSAYNKMLLDFACLLTFGLTLASAISLLLWVKRSSAAIEAGGKCLSTAVFSRIVYAFVIPISVLLILWTIAAFIELRTGYAVILIVWAILIMGALFFTIFLSRTMRKEGVKKGKNRATTYVFYILSTLVIGAVMIIWLVDLPYESAEAGMDGKYKEKMTLTAEDLRDLGDVEYGYNWSRTETPFMSDENGEQFNIYGESDEYSLSYEILRIKKEWLYDRCLKEWSRDYDLKKTKIDGVHADDVYQSYWEGKPHNEWVFCYPNGMAHVDLFFDADEGDLQKIDQIMFDNVVLATEK